MLKMFLFFIYRCLPPFRWLISSWCCKTRNQAAGELARAQNGGVLLLNSTDSVRTLTTSLTISKRSTAPCMRPTRERVVFMAAVAAAATAAATTTPERPKNVSEV